MAADRKPFHRGCVKCYQCRISLNPRTLNEREEQLFCNVCYEKIFNAQDFTVDSYGGIVTPEDIERWYFLARMIDKLIIIELLQGERKGKVGRRKKKARPGWKKVPRVRKQDLSRGSHRHLRGGLSPHLRKVHWVYAGLWRTGYGFGPSGWCQP